MAVEHRKRPKTFLDHVEKVIDWRPAERLLKKKLRRNKDAIGNPAYPAVSMFKVLLLQRWYNLSDREMDYALADRISLVLRHFAWNSGKNFCCLFVREMIFGS
jgi:IS5 family transposase